MSVTKTRREVRMMGIQLVVERRCGELGAAAEEEIGEDVDSAVGQQDGGGGSEEVADVLHDDLDVLFEVENGEADEDGDGEGEEEQGGGEAAALPAPEGVILRLDAPVDVEGEQCEGEIGRGDGDDDQHGQADELLDFDAEDGVFEPVGHEDGQNGEDPQHRWLLLGGLGSGARPWRWSSGKAAPSGRGHLDV